MDLLAGLNENQRAAVVHESGPLLIFAGAGSGKTRTLTHRIAYLIQEQHVSPARILAVTFTNKAAKEMRERLEKIIGEGAARRLWMGTFHSMCARMLRMHGHYIGLSERFVIFDHDDSTRLMKSVINEVGLDSKSYPASRVLGRISDAKNNMQSAEAFAANMTRPYEKQIAKLYTKYQERLRQSDALDFDDLLLEAVRLLQQSEESLDYWSERFQHVMIDEFQDANAAQFKWAELLASRHRNICVVGDDDQSIYAWRGANVRLILEFEEHYPDVQIIKLEQNYRSRQNILDAAHGVISQNLGRSPKKLWSEFESGEPVMLHGAANAQDEAWWVVDQIKNLQRSENLRLSDFVILCRVNAQSRPFEEAFLRARMPLRLVGTQRFYERREIKDLIAYLKVLYNPNDSVALIRIINVPARGIGATTISKLESIAQDSECSVWQIIGREENDHLLGKTVATKIAPLRELIRYLQNMIAEGQPLTWLLTQLLKQTRYVEHLRAERDGKGEDREANVNEFLAAAEDFDMRFEAMQRDLEELDGEEGEEEYTDEVEITRLGSFLELITLDSDASGAASSEDGDAATLMTLHSAKGLEFPVVFLSGMEQGLLPHSRALWGENATRDDLEEERRLCYVGITRARHRIFLTHAAQRTLNGRTETTKPSQFLEEIPANLMQRSGFARESSRSYLQASTDWDSPYTSRDYAPEYTSSATEKVDDSPPRFATGDKVKHPRFGEGLVVNSANRGGIGEWVEVAFLAGGIGKKKLIVAYAPLEKVS